MSEGNTDRCVIASSEPTRRGRRPWHVWKFLVREPDFLAIVKGWDERGGNPAGGIALVPRPSEQAPCSHCPRTLRASAASRHPGQRLRAVLLPLGGRDEVTSGYFHRAGDEAEAPLGAAGVDGNLARRVNAARSRRATTASDIVLRPGSPASSPAPSAHRCAAAGLDPGAPAERCAMMPSTARFVACRSASANLSSGHRVPPRSA